MYDVDAGSVLGASVKLWRRTAWLQLGVFACDTLLAVVTRALSLSHLEAGLLNVLVQGLYLYALIRAAVPSGDATRRNPLPALAAAASFGLVGAAIGGVLGAAQVQLADIGTVVAFGSPFLMPLAIALTGPWAVERIDPRRNATTHGLLWRYGRLFVALLVAGLAAGFLAGFLRGAFGAVAQASILLAGVLGIFQVAIMTYASGTFYVAATVVLLRARRSDAARLSADVFA